jgi:hypothetical protein
VLIRKNEEKAADTRDVRQRGQLDAFACGACARERERERQEKRDAVIIVSYILLQESGKLIRFIFIGQSSPIVRIMLFLTRCDSRESAQHSRRLIILR